MSTSMEESDVNRDEETMNDVDLRIAILSRGPRLYSTRRLVEEAKKRGLNPYVADPMKFSLFVADLSLIHI